MGPKKLPSRRTRGAVPYPIHEWFKQQLTFEGLSRIGNLLTWVLNLNPGVQPVIVLKLGDQRSE